jgi:hypothetical protein
VSCLREEFHECPPDADKATLIMYARADDNYIDDGSSDDEDTMYDTRTREGLHVEQGPVLDRVVCCLLTLFRYCNDVSFY